MIEGLQFDPELHLYRFDGALVPSVSDIMRPLFDFGGVRREVLAAAADRGSKAHLATELWDMDDLDEEALDPALQPFVDAHIAFRRDSGFVPELIEHRLYHARYRYAGTADRIGRFGRTRAVIDYKTTGSDDAKLTPKVGVQLAAYLEAFNSQTTRENRIRERWGVMLRANGTYEVQMYSNTDDWACFLHLLGLYNWRKNHNV